MEEEIYQILKRHRLSLKKREEILADLMVFLNDRDLFNKPIPDIDTTKYKRLPVYINGKLFEKIKTII
jgi:hypothetical protein